MGKRHELSKNVYFEGQNKDSMAGWFQSRESHLYCIVNKEVGSQPNIQIAKGLKGWEKANKGGYGF